MQVSSQGADNKKVNQIAENSADSHWKRKRVYSIIIGERKPFLLWRKNQLKDFLLLYCS